MWGRCVLLGRASAEVSCAAALAWGSVQRCGDGAARAEPYCFANVRRGRGVAPREGVLFIASGASGEFPINACVHVAQVGVGACMREGRIEVRLRECIGRLHHSGDADSRHLYVWGQD